MKETIPAFRLVRSRRKSLSVEITREGNVVVRAPDSLSDQVILEFVAEKQAWIRRHQDRMMQRIRDAWKNPRQHPTPELLKQMTDEARVYIPGRVQYYARRIGVTVGRITIRHQKTRWGSCSSKGNLNFNVMLMAVPEELLDYVVVHELCHRKEMNHSPRFWAWVESVLPDYRDRRRRLKEIPLL